MAKWLLAEHKKGQTIIKLLYSGKIHKYIAPKPNFRYSVTARTPNNQMAIAQAGAVNLTHAREIKSDYMKAGGYGKVSIRRFGYKR